MDDGGGAAGAAGFERSQHAAFTVCLWLVNNQMLVLTAKVLLLLHLLIAPVWPSHA
jgi:hypothetical protein